MRTRFHYAIRGQRKDVRTWLNNEIAAGKVLLTIRINAITPYMFCLDIDECLSLPCGRKANNNCTNIKGSYECSACDEGLFLFQRRCIGMYPMRTSLLNYSLC